MGSETDIECIRVLIENVCFMDLVTDMGFFVSLRRRYRISGGDFGVNYCSKQDILDSCKIVWDCLGTCVLD